MLVPTKKAIKPRINIEKIVILEARNAASMEKSEKSF